MKKLILALFLIFLVLLALNIDGLGCSRAPAPAPELPTTTMRLGSADFTLEIARDETSLQRGLMFRASMPGDRGMVFVFDSEEKRSFWMENTLIPLDLIYLDNSGNVISIHRLKPYDRTGVRSAGPARYAIEINQGMAEKAGIKVGDRVKLPGEIVPQSPATRAGGE